MPRPCHFDLTTDDPQKAMQFYKDVFGGYPRNQKEEEWNIVWLLQAPRSKKELTMASPKEVRKAYA